MDSFPFSVPLIPFPCQSQLGSMPEIRVALWMPIIWLAFGYCNA